MLVVEPRRQSARTTRLCSDAPSSVEAPLAAQAVRRFAQVATVEVSGQDLSLGDIESSTQITQCGTAMGGNRSIARCNTRQHRQTEAAGDEAQDRGCVIGGVIDEMPFGERRNNNRRSPRPRAPAIPLWRRDMIPESAIFVIGDDHQHTLPLRTLLEVSNEIREVHVARQYIGVSRMLVQIALWLIECDLR